MINQSIETINKFTPGEVVGIVIATFFILFIIIFTIFKILELKKHNRRMGKTNRISLGMVLKWRKVRNNQIKEVEEAKKVQAVNKQMETEINKNTPK